MYQCELCGGQFERYETPGQCPRCNGTWALAKCAACGHSADPLVFIANANRCPKCGPAAPAARPESVGTPGQFTRQEIFEKVQAALVDALGVEEEEVTPEATLVGDLGAESIDFLDIQFRLNKAFNIKIDNDELYPQDVLTNPAYVQDGKVTEAGIEELRRRMPYANLDRFAPNSSVQELSSVLTVEDLCRFVESKVVVSG